MRTSVALCDKPRSRILWWAVNAVAVALLVALIAALVGSYLSPVQDVRFDVASVTVFVDSWRGRVRATTISGSVKEELESAGEAWVTNPRGAPQGLLTFKQLICDVPIPNITVFDIPWIGQLKQHGAGSPSEGELRLSSLKLNYIPPIGLLFIVLAAVHVARTLIRKRRVIRGHCRQCGYDLRCNISGVCPECGRAIISNSA